MDEKKSSVPLFDRIQGLYESVKSLRELEEYFVSTLFEQFDLAQYNQDGQLVYFREGVRAEGKLHIRRFFMANFYNFVSYRDRTVFKDEGYHGWWTLRGHLCRINYECDSVWLPRGVDAKFILDIIEDYYGKTPAKAPEVPKDMYIGDVEQSVLDDLRFWINKRVALTKKGIPNKRVYLLNGPPGTGKSKLVEYLKHTMGMESVDLDIEQVFGKMARSSTKEKDADSVSAQKSIKELNLDNKLVIIEDIHLADFNRIREDQFNNFLNGNLTPPNCIIIMTCNDRSKLPTVFFRPGRVDLEVTYKVFDKSGLMFIANNFLEDKTRAEKVVDEYIANPVESEFYMTPAHFTQVCVNLIKEDIEREKSEIIVQQ